MPDFSPRHLVGGDEYLARTRVLKEDTRGVYGREPPCVTGESAPARLTTVGSHGRQIPTLVGSASDNVAHRQLATDGVLHTYSTMIYYRTKELAVDKPGLCESQEDQIKWFPPNQVAAIE